MTKDVVRVIFRVWDDDGEVLALFPDLPASPGNCTSYAHVGQHSAADYGHCIAKSRPATVEEYSQLANELQQIGYQLQIRYKR